MVAPERLHFKNLAHRRTARWSARSTLTCIVHRHRVGDPVVDAAALVVERALTICNPELGDHRPETSGPARCHWRGVDNACCLVASP